MRSPSDAIVCVPFSAYGFQVKNSLLTRAGKRGKNAKPRVRSPSCFVSYCRIVQRLIRSKVVVTKTAINSKKLTAALTKVYNKDKISISVGKLVTSCDRRSSAGVLFDRIPKIVLRVDSGSFSCLSSRLLLRSMTCCPVKGLDARRRKVEFEDSEGANITRVLTSLLKRTSRKRS